MFGFLGGWQHSIDIISAGNVHVGVRTFPMALTIANVNFNNFRKTAFVYFDVDEANVIKADLQALVSNTFITYNNDRTHELPTTIRSDSGDFSLLKNVSRVLRGFRYNSTTTLTPTLRRIRILASMAQHIDAFILPPVQNNQAKTATSNVMFGSVTLDLRPFINMKDILINEWVITDLLLLLPEGIEQVSISELVGTIEDGLTCELPSSVKRLRLSGLTGVTAVSKLNAMLSRCNLESLQFCGFSPYPNILSEGFLMSGDSEVLDLSHMTSLREFMLFQQPGNVLASVNFASGLNNWINFHLRNCIGVAAALTDAELDNILTSPGLKSFLFFDNQRTWLKTWDNTDISSSLKHLYIYQNSVVGDITITAPKPSVESFKTGFNTLRAGKQQNSHPAVNLTGLTNATSIDLSGSDISDLQLPVNTVITELILIDNHLSILTNPNLVAQINAMTSLVTLRTGLNTDGQDGAEGLGSNVDLSGLINMTTCVLDSSQLQGTLTVANVDKLFALYVRNNPDLTAIANLAAHVNLSELAWSGTGLNLSLATFVSLRRIYCENTTQVILDLSARTSTVPMTSMIVTNNSNLTSIVFPSTPSTCFFANGFSFTLFGNPNLVDLTNMDQINFAAHTSNNVFSVYNCALNITFPLGVNNFIPNLIQIQNNGMSTVNVDASINNVYQNRSKFGVYTLLKTLNIGGTNAAPSGTYQAPIGFVPGSIDGLPNSAKEQVYVLVNNYGWNVVMN